MFALDNKVSPFLGNWFFQNAEVGSNLIKLASTTARALKEKDDQVYCQPELLYEGKMHLLSLGLGKGNISWRPPRPLHVIPPSEAKELLMGERQRGSSWDAPVKSIWGQLSFLGLQTTPRKARGWLLGPTTFTSVLYKCCDVLNMDVHSDFYLYPFTAPCRIGAHSSISQRENRASEKLGCTHNVEPSNRSHSHWRRAS